MSDKIVRSVVGLLPENKIPGLEDFRQEHIHHPGKDVPFHITLMQNFFVPAELTDVVEKKLVDIAASENKFEITAQPLSAFPTTRALYLTPTPVGPIERLNDKLFTAFPEFRRAGKGYPVYHMTIALGYEDEKTVVSEFIKQFGYKSMELKAGSLAVFCECDDGKWKVYKDYPLGGSDD